MEISEFKITEIKPSNGLYLTQATDVADEERTYCTTVYLAPTDSPENWREATQEEKDAYDEMVRTRMEEEYEAIDSESV